MQRCIAKNKCRLSRNHSSTSRAVSPYLRAASAADVSPRISCRISVSHHRVSPDQELDHVVLLTWDLSLYRELETRFSSQASCSTQASIQSVFYISRIGFRAQVQFLTELLQKSNQSSSSVVTAGSNQTSPRWTAVMVSNRVCSSQVFNKYPLAPALIAALL